MRATLVTALALACVAGCAGNVSVPDTTIAELRTNQQNQATQGRALMQGQSELAGKMSTLIQMKQKEIDSLREVTEEQRQTRALLERLLDLRASDRAAADTNAADARSDSIRRGARRPQD